MDALVIAMIAQVVFWTSVLLLTYCFVGYPLLVCLWARLRPYPVTRRGWEPTVTLIVVAHNEAARIDDRLANLTSLDYPRHRLQILLASDGSTDGTAERARAWKGAGVLVLAFAQRRGKPAVLSDTLELARGEIVVLADARQRFAPDAIRALVAPLADPTVGVVSGELLFAAETNESVLGEGVGAYWRYEKLIRWSESRVGSTVRATGAIYAIRRNLFEPIPADTILDDVWLPMRIARQGYRVVFEPGARAWDRAPATAAEEFARKVRTLVGNFQLLARERWLLSPWRNRLWLQTVSHLMPRLVTPFLLLAALGADLFLAGDSRLHRVTLAGQLAFYAAALGGHALRAARRRIRILTIPYVICLLNVAALVACLRFVRGRQAVTWDKPARATSLRGRGELVRKAS